jgi:hypothetical protein
LDRIFRERSLGAHRFKLERLRTLPVLCLAWGRLWGIFVKPFDSSLGQNWLRRFLPPPTVERATLAANKEPSQSSLARAQALGREIIAAVERRSEIIAAEGIDPAFALPDANWHPNAANDYCAAYQMLRTLRWDEIKYLRFRAQSFSGYSLLHFTREPGTRSIEPVPSDFDSRIRAMPPNNLLARWRSLTGGMPQHLIYQPPPMLGEVGWWIDGILLNDDTATYQERMTLLTLSGFFKRVSHPPRILEIGGGYGALASALLSALPGCEYWICDLPESLLFSGLYLSLTRNEDIRLHGTAARQSACVNLLPNYLFGRLDRGFDLVINTLSMSEMSEHQIECYAAGISKLLGTSGTFFEQNQDNRQMGLGYCKPSIAKYFAKRMTIKPSFVVHNGVVDLWSN